MGSQPDQSDRLKVRAVGARGLEPERRELRRDVSRGEPAAPRAGGASLEQIIGEVADMRVQCRAAYRRERRRRRGGALALEWGHAGDDTDLVSKTTTRGQPRS